MEEENEAAGNALPFRMPPQADKQLKRKRKVTIWILVTFINAAIFILDIRTSPHMVVGVFYILPVFIMQYTRLQAFLYSEACISTVLLLTGLFLWPGDRITRSVLVNRLLTLFALWTVAAACISQIHAYNAKRKVRKSIAKKIRDENRMRKVSLSLLEDMRQAKALIEQAEARFRLVVESAPNAIIMIDREGRMVLVNRQAEALFGYAREALAGRDVELLIPARYRKSHAASVKTFFCDPKVRPMGTRRDLFGRHLDGREIPVEIGLNPIETPEGICVLASIIDITERKRAEREIENKNQELQTLLHIVSHDLKEPLRSVEYFSTLVKQRYAHLLDEKGQDFLMRSATSALRMKELIDDILMIARARQITAPSESIDGRTVVADALKSLESSIRTTKARVRAAEYFPPLRVDKVWATQAVANLVANALKFTRPGEAPDVAVDAFESNGGQKKEVGFVVKDRGPGVAPAHAEKIFSLFQRAVGRDIEGTGAGLAIVREIARQHGGRAWVRPRPGGGSEFVITFKVWPARNAAAIEGGQPV